MATKNSKNIKKTTTKKSTRAAAPATRVVETVVPDEYRPISMWGYFGWELLFAVPVIGWIICICLAFAANNRNLRNFARSQFCVLIISVILVCLLAGVGAIRTIIEAFGII